MAELLHCIFLALEGVGAPRAAGRSEKAVVDGEVLLGEHPEQFLTHGAAGAHYSYIHFLRLVIYVSQLRPLTSTEGSIFFTRP